MAFFRSSTTVITSKPPQWALRWFSKNPPEPSDEFEAQLAGAVTEFDRRLYHFGILREVDRMPNVNFWETALRIAAEEHPLLREKKKTGPKPKGEGERKPDMIARRIIEMVDQANKERPIGEQELTWIWGIELQVAKTYQPEHHMFERICDTYRTHACRAS